MKHVSFRTILTLDESKISKKKNNVPLVLDINHDRLWSLDSKAREIDVIEAIFSNDRGESGDLGKVSVKISLLAGARFKKPYVSVVKNPQGNNKIECVEYRVKRSRTVLVLDFLEPNENQHLHYPNIYFHTTKGIIDPVVNVTRGPIDG